VDEEECCEDIKVSCGKRDSQNQSKEDVSAEVSVERRLDIHSNTHKSVE
jgi:hypothetical protein